MNENIRAATESDVPQLVELIREFARFENLSEFCEATAEDLRAALFGADACVEGLLAFSEKEAVGYALFYENFSSFRGQRGLYLEDLYVKSEYRGQKIGEAFLKRVAGIARSRGFKRIDFMVLEWNDAAIEFYKKLGAVKDEAERHFKFTDRAFEKLSE